MNVLISCAASMTLQIHMILSIFLLGKYNIWEFVVLIFEVFSFFFHPLLALLNWFFLQLQIHFLWSFASVTESLTASFKPTYGFIYLLLEVDGWNIEFAVLEVKDLRKILIISWLKHFIEFRSKEPRWRKLKVRWRGQWWVDWLNLWVDIHFY